MSLSTESEKEQLQRPGVFNKKYASQDQKSESVLVEFDPTGPGADRYLNYLHDRLANERLVFDASAYRRALLRDAFRMVTFQTPHRLPPEPDWEGVKTAKSWLKDAVRGRNTPPRPIRPVKR